MFIQNLQHEASMKDANDNPQVETLHQLNTLYINDLTWKVAANVHTYRTKKFIIFRCPEGTTLHEEKYSTIQDNTVKPCSLSVLYIFAKAPRLLKFMVDNHKTTLKHVTVGLKYTSDTASELVETTKVLNDDCTLQVVLEHIHGSLCDMWIKFLTKRFISAPVKLYPKCIVCHRREIIYPPSL